MSNATPALSWEEGRPEFAKLWVTACQTAAGFERWVPELRNVSLWRALSFAFMAELGAALSLTASVGVIMALVWPRWIAELAMTPEAWLFGLGSSFGFAALMVLLHVAWGAALEALLQRRGSQANPTLSLGFALYACGWDLITCPLGALWAFARGGRPGLRVLGLAATAPRHALHSYLTEQRGLPAKEARGVALTSFAIVLGTVATASALVAAALWRAAHA